MTWRVGADERRELIMDDGVVVGEVLATGNGHFRPRLVNPDGTRTQLPDWLSREDAQHCVEFKVLHCKVRHASKS